MNNFDRQLEDVLSLLANPMGVLALLLLLTLAVMAVVNKRLRWLMLAVLLISTMITVPTFSVTAISSGEVLFKPLMFPFESIRAQSRAISSLVVCLLLLPAISMPTGWRRTIIPLGMGAYLLFQITFSILELVNDHSARNLLSVPLFIVTFFSAGLGVNKMLQSGRDVNSALWAFIGAFAVTAVFMLIQMLAGDRNALFMNSRMQGMTANPQFLATMIPPALITICFLLLDKDQPKLRKVVLGGLGGLLSVFLVWTGSRTGMLMLLVGVLTFFRLRVGQFLLVAGIVGICVLGVMQFLGNEGSDQGEHLLGMQDTRTYVWQRQWNRFLESPLLGSSAEGGGFMGGGGENSYLTVAAAYGIVGLIPFLFMLFFMVTDLVSTWRVRQLVPDQKELINLIIAVFAMAAAGAWFEAYLLGQFNVIVLVLFIYSAIGAWIRDKALAEQAQSGQDGQRVENTETMMA